MTCSFDELLFQEFEAIPNTVFLRNFANQMHPALNQRLYFNFTICENPFNAFHDQNVNPYTPLFVVTTLVSNLEFNQKKRRK